MLNRGILLFCACVLFIGAGRTQSISEQLKQADCQFEIYYEDQKLDVIKQMITKRAVHYQDTEGGYAYETYFLEWVYENGHEIKDDSQTQAHFYTSQNQKIHSIRIGWSDYLSHEYLRKKNQSPKNNNFKRYYYSISLEKVPVFVLDDTFKIVISK
ncbi:MAG: hypothetical protein U5R06_00530 [candidate division KSB1 bacterium]|nr:hypothetical protein [candidate division KSB1 bacterium]